MIHYERHTNNDDILKNSVEVSFVDADTSDGFNKVKETLTRMGIPNVRENKLIQTAHILHRRGHYYICHFLEMYALDGRMIDLEDADIGRRNLIVKYLIDWDLVKPITDNWKDPMIEGNKLKVIKYSDKQKWQLAVAYTMRYHTEIVTDAE